MPQRLLRKGDLVVAHSKVYDKKLEKVGDTVVGTIYTPVPAGTMGQVLRFFEQNYDSIQLKNTSVAVVKFGEDLLVPISERALTLVRRTKQARARTRKLKRGA